MQTPGEKKLIAVLAEAVSAVQASGGTPHILNVGAAKSVVLENSVAKLIGNADFICDRADIDDCEVKESWVGKCFTAPVEDMPQAKTGDYDVVFANYVFEHINDLDKAINELKRILKPDGLFIVASPNPSAPEFLLARFTPLWFHQIIKGVADGHRAYRTTYLFPSLESLARRFKRYGFSVIDKEYYAFTFGYLHPYPIIKTLSKVYDAIVRSIASKTIMGNACFVFKKNS